MAGHSKWANIKRQKARVDAQKGKVFARLSREIIVAARHGLPDPAGNFQLRTAISKAKAAGIPQDNIERAIAKGAGTWDTDGEAWEAIRYEGYGPGGVAILMEALTDNRNRTAADIRAAFNKYEGNLGETGCVGWMFEQWGLITLPRPANEEAFLEILLEGEAEGYEALDPEEEEEPLITVKVAPPGLEPLTNLLTQADYAVERSELAWMPINTVELTDRDQAKRVLRLVDALEDLDDLQSVTANFELSPHLRDLF